MKGASNNNSFMVTHLRKREWDVYMEKTNHLKGQKTAGIEEYSQNPESMAEVSPKKKSNSTAQGSDQMQSVYIAQHSTVHSTVLYCAGETERDWFSSERSHCDRSI